jgi:hypothetical protein
MTPYLDDRSDAALDAAEIERFGVIADAHTFPSAEGTLVSLTRPRAESLGTRAERARRRSAE